MQKEQLLKRLGNRVRKIRNEKGLSQVELANSIGKDQQSIQRLESGKVNPSFFYLYEISEGLEVELNELLRKL